MKLLQGVRVAEAGANLGAEIATLLLAEAGAEVLKIEPPACKLAQRGRILHP
jgi:crotonobetainyl-CoA:carnitine CoA-transferase CaiB-like acyl-CoA transferase